MKFFLFGVIQGLTEFLPISSSGHLFLFKKIMKIEGNLLPFFILLHVATLFAVILFFANDIAEIFKKKNKKLIFYFCLITGVTAMCGLAIKHFFGGLFEQKYVIALCFFINAVILLTIQFLPRKRTRADITAKDSFIVGVLQGVAVFPGISRSGITISGFLHRGFTAVEAFTLSFLAGIPVILGAFLVEIKDVSELQFSFSQLSFGFIGAFFSGIGVLIILKQILINVQFKKFGYYSLLMVLLTLFLG